MSFITCLQPVPDVTVAVWLATSVLSAIILQIFVKACLREFEQKSLFIYTTYLVGSRSNKGLLLPPRVKYIQVICSHPVGSIAVSRNCKGGTRIIRNRSHNGFSV